MSSIILRFFKFQSTLPVWGAAPDNHSVCPFPLISIHAPRVGSDFLADIPQYTGDISIHAPRVGSDRLAYVYQCYLEDFNPRSPCGERPYAKPSNPRAWNFNPRSPCGERL